MNTFFKYLYSFGLKKLDFKTLEEWAKNNQTDNLIWALSLDDLLIQEKAFKLLAYSPSLETVLSLCDFASTCSWQLNQTVFTNLLELLNQNRFSEIKNQKHSFVKHMEEALSAEKIARIKDKSDGRELPSDRLKQIQKDHRGFMSRGLKQLRKK